MSPSSAYKTATKNVLFIYQLRKITSRANDTWSYVLTTICAQFLALLYMSVCSAATVFRNFLMAWFKKMLFKWQWPNLQLIIQFFILTPSSIFLCSILTLSLEIISGCQCSKTVKKWLWMSQRSRASQLVNCTMYLTLHSVSLKLYSATIDLETYCTVHCTACCVLCTVHCALFSVQCPLSNVHCELLSVHSAMYTVQY